MRNLEFLVIVLVRRTDDCVGIHKVLIHVFEPFVFRWSDYLTCIIEIYIDYGISQCITGSPRASFRLFDLSWRQQGRFWTFLIIFLRQILLGTGASHNICDVRATTTCRLKAGNGQRKKPTDLHTLFIFLASRCHCADPVIRRKWTSCLRDLRF